MTLTFYSPDFNNLCLFSFFLSAFLASLPISYIPHHTPNSAHLTYTFSTLYTPTLLVRTSCASPVFPCTSLRPTVVRVQSTHASLITTCAHLHSVQPHWLHLRFTLFCSLVPTPTPHQPTTTTPWLLICLLRWWVKCVFRLCLSVVILKFKSLHEALLTAGSPCTRPVLFIYLFIYLVSRWF